MKYPEKRDALWRRIPYPSDEWEDIWLNKNHVCITCAKRVLPPQLWITTKSYPQPRENQ